MKPGFSNFFGDIMNGVLHELEGSRYFFYFFERRDTGFRNVEEIGSIFIRYGLFLDSGQFGLTNPGDSELATFTFHSPT